MNRKIETFTYGYMVGGGLVFILNNFFEITYWVSGVILSIVYIFFVYKIDNGEV